MGGGRRFAIEQLSASKCVRSACRLAPAAQDATVTLSRRADAFCGPLLACKAAQARAVDSMVFADQPALIRDLVDWARQPVHLNRLFYPYSHSIVAGGLLLTS